MGPLSGYLVVDAAVYIAGPFAAQALADLGAEVVKVEPPKGDAMRRFGKQWNKSGVIFANMNRGKRRVRADLKAPEGAAELMDLVRRADVLVENWRPGVADRLGFSDQALWAANPRLVHCSVTGFGQSGPRSQLPAFDTVVQALSGLAWLHSRDGKPQPVRTYLVDKLTGMFAAQSVLAALLEREKTGVGRRVDVDMLSTAHYFNFPEVFATRTVLEDDEMINPEDEVGANSILRVADGWIVVAPNRGEHVRDACRAAGHPEWVEELRTIRDTKTLNPALMSRLATATAAGGTAAEWIAKFEAFDVPVAPVLDLDGALADPHVVETGIYQTAEDPELGKVRFPRYPARFGAQPDLRGGAPGPTGR